MSVHHRWAGAPEKRCELIQLPLQAAGQSKDNSTLGEEGTGARLQEPGGMQAGQIVEEPKSQALLQASSETS